jgi:hypothetical protein
MALVASVYCIPIPRVSAQTTCTSLSYDLSSGSSDQGSAGPIYMLQNYLRYLGYLGATPNGHFGPATLSAVKTYQSTNNISATGFVGPVTRASISNKTCNTVAPTTTTVITPTTSSPAAVVNPVQAVSNVTITSPSTGQLLSVGSTTVIRWNTSPANSYNIVLEQPGGIGAGFIAQGLSSNTGSNQYVWSVGKIFSSDMNSNQNVAAGTYRIRLEGVSSGALSTDQVSGWFTIVAPQFVVNSVMPSSSYADDATSVVLFGSGFTTSSSVYFGTNNSSLRANNTYVSPDGTVLVFTIPTTVPAGSYTLFINNGTGLSPARLPFVVSSIQ